MEGPWVMALTLTLKSNVAPGEIKSRERPSGMVLAMTLSKTVFTAPVV